MSQRGDILAVIGGQFGSEGKGNIVAYMANRYDMHVRVGGPNAGHSFKREGRVWKMQSIPCGWVNRNAVLIIGAGALVSVQQLAEEWREIVKVDPTITDRLHIDMKAGIISPWHHAEAGGVKGEAHHRYGSTGEGVGVARRARIERWSGDAEEKTGFYHAGNLPMSQVPEDFQDAWKAMLDHDTAGWISEFNELGKPVLLEGTQGSGLSLIHGPWPFVTNHDTNAAQLAADCGIPPRFVNRCLMVVRTLPIRVAGNSGPLHGEISWEEVSNRVGHAVEEKTTVTKKTRRIGEWDEAMVWEAVKLNAPTSVAINFMDYLSPEDEGVSNEADLSERAQGFIKYAETLCAAPVRMVGTGGKDDWTVCPIGAKEHEAWRL